MAQITAEEALTLAAKIEAIASNPASIHGLQNDLPRERLREAGRKLSHAMEIPIDTARRLQATPLELPAALIGVEKGIFSALVSQSGTTSISELSEKTRIDPVLLKRLLRFYQANDMITQPGDDAYVANNITRGMTTLCCSAGVEYFFESVLPAFVALPQFLRDYEYKNPTNPDQLPWHVGHKTDLNPFPWLLKHPRQMEVFMQAMATLRDGMPNWFDHVDFRQEILHGHDTDPSVPLFVDVGGAMGQQSIFFKNSYPDLKGRIIVQDQAQVVSQIEATPLPGFAGIEAMAHDFFKPQPIKGARAYYLRMIFHDWPDHKAVEILRHLRDAMTEGSYLLIDETVLSEKQAPWKAAFMDMTMMCQLGAQERTKAEWERLMAESGFKILRICEYAPDTQESLIIAVKST
ncbi:O-methyltransferase [Diaporthe helianthi]|uniref:O-methyltransferase n=1 Tax=Diaporthe helianthi TaxID=158607 RepID=A0A2P5HJ67_DIAHE|nr:O-methyltransferase [Diaporthe helianthi]